MAYGSAACKTAISIEFVANPNEAHRVHALVPAAIAATLEGVEEFAGCAVMESSQEERVVTVLTFWHGELTARAAAVNSTWVRKILDRYMDHPLRVQTMRTQLAIAALKHVDNERDEQGARLV
jgi:transposase InsO family protein